MTSEARSSARRQAGFTLLEVMCAFAILAVIVGFMAQSWSYNMEKATRAVSKRELREAGDTLFRRILYELQEHADGTSGNLEDYYGEWTGFKGAEREKWRIYSFVLTKRIKTAAGTSDEADGHESIFGDEGDLEDEGSGSSSGSGSGSGSEDEAQAAVNLTQVTMKIYLTDEMDDEPILTLSTFIRPGTEDEK